MWTEFLRQPLPRSTGTSSLMIGVGGKGRLCCPKFQKSRRDRCFLDMRGNNPAKSLDREFAFRCGSPTMLETISDYGGFQWSAIPQIAVVCSNKAAETWSVA